MIYKFIPNSYNYNSISELEGLGFDILKLQVYYKQCLERVLNSIFNFSNIDKYIGGLNFPVPIINDKEYNFYRKYSILGSKYVYLRNNIHLERLTKEELSLIKESFYNKKLLDIDFIYKTLGKVLFEDGDYTFFGIPVLKNMVNSQSIVFEFAYNQLQCESVAQVRNIENAYLNIFDKIKEVLEKKLNISVAKVIYDSIPDNYKINEEDKIDNIIL